MGSGTMTSAVENYEVQKQRYDHHMAERSELIDAARESLRTFDKAVLAFGSAVFGASVAFVKDVAPKPQSHTIPWLCASWICFAVGLLEAVLSFLFSYQTCIARIDHSAAKYLDPEKKEPKDWWGILTSFCNWGCVVCLFSGVIAWIVFAVKNLAISGGK